MLCGFLCLFILSTIYKKVILHTFYTYTIIILYSYINFVGARKLYFILDGFEKYTQRDPKSSINEVLLATFHKQEQKSLGFWVFWGYFGGCL